MLFLGFFVFGVLLAPVAEFIQFYLPLGFFLVFARPVVLVLASGALKFDQMVLAHACYSIRKPRIKQLKSGALRR